jgi:peptidylprolyl isomerase
MTKPSMTPKTDPVPATLVMNDLVVGDGAEAKPGNRVDVHYVQTSRNQIFSAR